MRIKRYLIGLIFLATAFFLEPITLEAHSPDQTYLYLRIYGDAMGGRVEMTPKDINRALGLSLKNGLTLEDLKLQLPIIQNYLKSRVKFRDKTTNYNIQFIEPTILKLGEKDNDKDDFIRFHFNLEGVKEIPELLDIEYNVMFDKDPIQRGMMIVEYNWKAGVVNNGLISNIFGPNETKTTLSLDNLSIWKGFFALIKLGIWHIWIGLDHILFIVALILPAVVRRRQDVTDMTTVMASTNPSPLAWLPVLEFKPAFWYIIKIITFFTVAHSITLALAALEIVNLPSRFVESVIALSIALAAFHNIIPIFKQKEWIMAFGFGLFHGFGFASVLGEKGLSGDYMVLSLLGFNVGVEVGQVLIICMVFPFLFFLRSPEFYPKLKRIISIIPGLFFLRAPMFYPRLITFGSMVLIFISLYWTIERGFDVDLPLGKYFWQSYDTIAQVFG